MDGTDMFDSYKNLQYLNYDELKLVVNYICAQLNSPTMNYAYWYDMYSYTSKTFMVIDFRKKSGSNLVGRLGEAVCNNEIMNFLRDKSHFNCSCSSVYCNAVF